VLILVTVVEGHASLMSVMGADFLSLGMRTVVLRPTPLSTV
jgi:hypothetical protein